MNNPVEDLILEIPNLLLVSLPRFEGCVDSRSRITATPREAVSLAVVVAVLDGASPRHAIPHFERAQGAEVYLLLHLQNLGWQPLVFIETVPKYALGLQGGPSGRGTLFVDIK